MNNEEVQRQTRLLVKAFGNITPTSRIAGEVDTIPEVSAIFYGLYLRDLKEFAIVAASGTLYIAYSNSDYFEPKFTVKGRNKKLRARVAAKKLNEAIGITEDQVNRIASGKKFI